MRRKFKKVKVTPKCTCKINLKSMEEAVKEVLLKALRETSTL